MCVCLTSGLEDFLTQADHIAKVISLEFFLQNRQGLIMVRVAKDHTENQSWGEQKPKVLQQKKCVLPHKWPWKFVQPRQKTKAIE